MYTTSQTFKDKARSNGRSAKGYVVIDGVTYDDSATGRLYGFDFEYLSDSFIGGFSAKCLVVKLDTSGIEETVFTNKMVNAYVGFEGAEYIPVGVFKVDEDGVETDDVAKTVRLTCFDSATKFDAKYSSSIIYPCTFRDFITDICSNVGITLDSKVLIFDSQILSQKPNMNELISNRDIISQYAQANLSKAFISRDNKLTFAEVFSDPSTSILIDGNDYDSINLERIQGPLNSLVLARTPQNDNVYALDDASISEFGSKQIKLENNIFLDDRREVLIGSMLNKVLGYIYRPFSVSYFALPQIDPGDVIEVAGGDDFGLPAPLCNISYSYTGSLLGKLSTMILPETLIKFELPSVEQRLANAEIKVDKVNLEILSTVSRIDGLESQTTEIEQSVNGITSTVNQQIDNLNTLSTTVNQNASSLNVQINSLNEMNTYYQYTADSLTIGKSSSPAQITIGYDSGSKPQMILDDGSNSTAIINSDTMTINNVRVAGSTEMGNHKVQKLSGSTVITIFLPIGV